MNPWKFFQMYELKKLLELQARLKAAGVDAGYLDSKIADLEAKLQ